MTVNFEKDIPALDAKVKVYYNEQRKSICIVFNKDLYVHKEVIDNINYALSMYKPGIHADDLIMMRLAEGFANYINMSAIGAPGHVIVKTDPFEGSIKITKGF